MINDLDCAACMLTELLFSFSTCETEAFFPQPVTCPASAGQVMSIVGLVRHLVKLVAGYLDLPPVVV